MNSPFCGLLILLYSTISDAQVVDDGYYVSGKVRSKCGHVGFFCKNGIKSQVSEGYYSIGGHEDGTTRSGQIKCEYGHYCKNGEKIKCPAGKFGAELGLASSDCSGECLAGYYCPIGSVSGNQHPCGSPSVYCPSGSIEPVSVRDGYYSIGGSGSHLTHTSEVITPPGYFAHQGQKFSCFEGSYGNEYGLFEPYCSGFCDAGYYCPPGSVSPKQNICGNSSVYCPYASAEPRPVRKGYYTSRVDDICPPGQWRNLTKINDKTIFPIVTESPIPTSSTLSPCQPCENGSFKFVPGNEHSLCLPCPKYTTISALDRTTCTCLMEYLYFNKTLNQCVKVSSNFKPVDDEIFANTELTRYEEFPCEKGHYCINGTRYPCPAGKYGSTIGNTNSSCDGMCSAGFYCPEGSISTMQYPCGKSNLFCPEGSPSPIFVRSGFFSNELKDDMFKDSELICPPGYWCENAVRKPCPAGRWGNSSGLVSSLCDGPCLAGYFCPEGSVSDSAFRCGSINVHCPEGSDSPIVTEMGYYSSRVGLQPSLPYAFDETSTMEIQVLCEQGYFCENGIRTQCPPGSYGVGVGGKSLSSACLPCSAGYYCPSQANFPSLTSEDRECGGPNVICPIGSAYPLDVSLGYYSVHNEYELICEPGHWCKDGIKNKCPAGSYGNEYGLWSVRCSGFCPAGFYCEEGVSDPIPCQANTYSVAGLDQCISCGPSSELIENSEMRCKDSRRCCQYRAY